MRIFKPWLIITFLVLKPWYFGIVGSIPCMKEGSLSVCYRQSFQLPAPSQCWEMIENTNISYVFWNTFSTTSSNMFEQHVATSRYIFNTSWGLFYQHVLILIPAQIIDYIHDKLEDQITVHSQTREVKFSWWRHQIETFSVLLDLSDGNSPVTSGFPLTKARDTELWCFLWSAPEQTVEQTIETLVIWDAIALSMALL